MDRRGGLLLHSNRLSFSSESSGKRITTLERKSKFWKFVANKLCHLVAFYQLISYWNLHEIIIVIFGTNLWRSLAAH